MWSAQPNMKPPPLPRESFRVLPYTSIIPRLLIGTNKYYHNYIIIVIWNPGLINTVVGSYATDVGFSSIEYSASPANKGRLYLSRHCTLWLRSG